MDLLYFYNLHLPDEVRVFSVPVQGIRRCDDMVLVYDVRIDRWVLRHYSFSQHWFEVNCIMDLEGRFVLEPGSIDHTFNCDISTPHHTDGNNFYNTDLFLDVLAWPDGRQHIVIDEEDFADALARGWLTEAERAGACRGLAELLEIITTQGLITFLDGIYPFGAVADAGVQPPFLRQRLADVPFCFSDVQPGPIEPAPLDKVAADL